MGYFTVKNVTNFVLGLLAFAAAVYAFFVLAPKSWVKWLSVEVAMAKYNLAALHQTRKAEWKTTREEIRNEIKAQKAKLEEEMKDKQA